MIGGFSRRPSSLECGDSSAFFSAELTGLLLAGESLFEAKVEPESVEPRNFRLDALGFEFGIHRRFWFPFRPRRTQSEDFPQTIDARINRDRLFGAKD